MMIMIMMMMMMTMMVTAALLRLPHSGFSVFLYLAMVVLSAIFFISEWPYPWRLGIITRCGGIDSLMSLLGILL